MKTLLLALATSVSLLAATCESLASAGLPHTTISIAETRQPGAFTPPSGGRPIGNLPAFCRVAGTIRPTSDSDIRFEVWLPASGWNGKFQGVGNGGYAGVINFAGLADAVRGGYASASTDTGHEDSRGNHAEWALQHLDKIADFGYRAIHETAVDAKEIIHAFYGDAPKRSYFNSCSNGGRQALMEAQLEGRCTARLWYPNLALTPFAICAPTSRLMVCIIRERLSSYSRSTSAFRARPKGNSTDGLRCH